MRPQVTGDPVAETCCRVKGSYSRLARSIVGRQRVPQRTTGRASQIAAAAAVSHGNKQYRYWALLTADRQQCEWKFGTLQTGV